MPDLRSITDRVFLISGPEEFNALALEIFHYQREHNQIYRSFTERVCRDPLAVSHFSNIPFLPVSFFKTHRIVCGAFEPEAIFQSSGTSGQQASRHYIWSLDWYHRSHNQAFSATFGKVEDHVILALLPSYLEQEGSSLVSMVRHLIEGSKQPQSGFFLYEHEKLSVLLKELRDAGKKVILFGVSYALLDFAERFPMQFRELILVETGGMKGRRKELVREALHDILKKAFHVQQVFSEYGMTEMLSQAYAAGDGRFRSPPWMKVLIRDANDPLSLVDGNRTGGINVIDLANIHSCAFIATQDLGRLNADGTFEVLGRFDHSDVRGCNLMVE